MRKVELIVGASLADRYPLANRKCGDDGLEFQYGNHVRWPVQFFSVVSCACALSYFTMLHDFVS